jgi:hypothetical protein
VNDAIGDTDTHPDFSGIAPDLVAGTIEVRDGNMKLTAQFAPNTLVQNVGSAQFSLDVDQSAATGSQRQDYTGLGSEFIVNMGITAQGLTKVFEYNPASARFIEVGSAALTYGATTMEATIPLSLLKNDDGKVNFKVVSWAALTANTSTGILDYMTDTGLPPGIVQ